MRYLLFAPVVVGLGLLTGCNPADMVDGNVQSICRQYFPLTEVVHPAPGVLLVDTHLSNATEKLMSQIMGQSLAQYGEQLRLVLPVVGYRMIEIQYEGGMCGWKPAVDYFVCADQVTHQRHNYPITGGFSAALPPVPPAPAWR